MDASGSKYPARAPLVQSKRKIDDMAVIDPDLPDLFVGCENLPSLVVGGSDQKDKSLAVVGSDSKDEKRKAQNREAAKRFRSKRKAYVTKLEEELEQARGNGQIKFNAEYDRWMQEQKQKIQVLVAAANELIAADNASDIFVFEQKLRSIVNLILKHYDKYFQLKREAAKTDVCHLFSGMWKTVAERCHLWLGGFKISDILELLVNQVGPLTDQQKMFINNLRQSSLEEEHLLSCNLKIFQSSMWSTGATSPTLAKDKLRTLEDYILQAEDLRHKKLKQMHNELTTRQSTLAIVALHEYFRHLHELSSHWQNQNI